MTDQNPDSGPEFPQDTSSRNNGPHESGGLPQVADRPYEDNNDAEENIMPEVISSQPPVEPSIDNGEVEPSTSIFETVANHPPGKQNINEELPSTDPAAIPDIEQADLPDDEEISSQDFLRDLENNSNVADVPESSQTAPVPSITDDDFSSEDMEAAASTDISTASLDLSNDDNSSEDVEAASSPDSPAPTDTSSDNPVDIPAPTSESLFTPDPAIEPNGNASVSAPTKSKFGNLISGDNDQSAPSALSPVAEPATDPWNNSSIPPPVQPVESIIPPIPEYDINTQEKDGEDAIRVLYVEDNPDNQVLVQRILLFEGFDIDFAQNAKEALEVSEHSTYDLILMDINLPDMDGYALTSIFRKMTKFSTIPIIALTANVMKGDRERSLDAGCDGYIQKPVNIDKLPAQIKGYLSTR